jgi:Pectate lyase superfamily protein
MATTNSSQWFNPVSDRLEAGGVGIIPSRLSSAQRLALSLTTADAGLTNYDVDARCIWTWNGAAWMPPTNTMVDVRAYGARGDGTTNDTQSVVNAIAAAATAGGRGFVYFPPGYTFLLNSRTGGGTSDPVSVPSGITFVIDGTITGSVGSTINFVAVGDFVCTSNGIGKIQIGQGNDARFFQIKAGVVEFSNLRFIGAGLYPTCINCNSTATGTLSSLTISNCSAENSCAYLYAREQSVGSAQAVLRTRITNCTIRSIFNGSGILINAISGLDRDILITDIVVDGVSGDSGGSIFSGFGIAVAGYGQTLPNGVYAVGAPSTRVQIANVIVNSCRSAVHVEYCNNVLLTGIHVDDINPAYYPAGSETFGVIVYGSSDVVMDDIHVSNVTQDQINAWAVGVRQINRNCHISNVHTYKGSIVIEQPIQTATISGIPPYELTTNSMLHVENCSTNLGNVGIYAVGTVLIRNNHFVGPLSFGPLTVAKFVRAANVATVTVLQGSTPGNSGVYVGDNVSVSGVGSSIDGQINAVTATVNYGASNYVVLTIQRAANVATITVFGNITFTVGYLIAVSSVGSGFDVAYALVTATVPGVNTTVSYANVGANTGPSAATGTLSTLNATEISYANTGANVGATIAAGTLYDYSNALLVDCQSNLYGANYNSVNRLSLTIENNRAATAYGAASFALRNITTNRIAANVQMHATGNNFGLTTSFWPVIPINRLSYTAAGTQPTGFEFSLGDQFSINIGGGGAHTNYICNNPGYVAVVGDTYAIVSAVAGTISRNGATSWLGSVPSYVYGQLVKLTNGANSIVGLVQTLSGTVGAAGTEIMTLVDPALGTAMDLTVLAGNGTIAPNSVATFVTF